MRESTVGFMTLDEAVSTAAHWHREALYWRAIAMGAPRRLSRADAIEWLRRREQAARERDRDVMEETDG